MSTSRTRYNCGQNSLEKLRWTFEKSLKKVYFGFQIKCIYVVSYTALLDLEPEEIILKPIDVDAVNALAKKILG